MDRDHIDEIDEIEPTEEEVAEAAALARALERGVAEAPPDDALEAAAVLRFSRDGGQLDPQRGEAILQTVLAEAKTRRAPQRGPLWRWLIPAGVASAVAAALVLTLQPRAATTLTLPTPSETLLRAQAAAAAGNGRALDEAMASYRGAVLASLEGRYQR